VAGTPISGPVLWIFLAAKGTLGRRLADSHLEKSFNL
jgi:hypothetical protein